MSKIREGGEKDAPLVSSSNSNNSLNCRRNSDRDLKSASDHERTSLAPSEDTNAAATPEGAFCPAHSKASSRYPCFNLANGLSRRSSGSGS